MFKLCFLPSASLFISFSIYLLSAFPHCYLLMLTWERRNNSPVVQIMWKIKLQVLFSFSIFMLEDRLSVCLKLMTISDVEIVRTVLTVVLTVSSTWCSSCCEPLTGLYPMFPSHWSWRWRGSATWLSKLWLKTRRPCWWVEPERPPLPLQAPPAQVSKNMGRTHTRSCSTHFSI